MKLKISLVSSLALSVCLLTTASAQSSSFTYQGRLADSGTAVNGNYDLQFGLWNSLSGGSQVGSTQTFNTVAVSNGVFTVSLDFGANAFPGTSRFLEIAVRPAGVGSFTTLTPRQPITSTPYAVRSLNAATADSVPASGVAAGSGNYIQNGSTQQASTNFNISGSGTAGGTLSGNILSATTQFSLNGNRILSNAGSQNLFVGIEVGVANTTGFGESFAGFRAGASNTTGGNNSFFGNLAGESNMTGAQNSFFGAFAGRFHVQGQSNSFFGSGAGSSDTQGFNNAYFGSGSGRSATGTNNTFIGAGADWSIVEDMSPSGSRNTLLGTFAGLLSGPQFTVDNATAIGANARVDRSNSLVLGSISGVNGADADTNVGIGTTSPTARLSVVASGDGARVLHLGTARAWVFRQFGTGAGSALELAGDDPNNNNKNFLINTQGFVGIGTTAPTANLSVNGSANKPGGGSWGTFSDERLKTIKGRFTPGLNALMQLQPLRYEYKPDNVLQLKADGEHIGFSAQAVQGVIPEAVSQTDSGYLVVNNDPIMWTMLNAIKEQQAQIQKQTELIQAQTLLTQRQQKEIAALKRIVSTMRTHR